MKTITAPAELRRGDRELSKGRFSRTAGVAIAATGFFAFALLSPATGSAATVSCGEVLTADTVVENDLTDCPADGLVIGAPNIVVDLNGHTIDGTTSVCEATPCTPRSQGVDNRAGHDGVTIKNGTVTGFHDGIRLSGVTDSTVENLTVRAFESQPDLYRFRGLTLVGSHDNQIDDVDVGGDPGLTLVDSDRNSVSESDLKGQGEAFTDRGGNGLRIAEGSDFNVVENSVVTGDGEEKTGTAIVNSSGNEIRDSELNPGAFTALVVQGSDNTTITGNAVNAAVELSSDGAVFSHNTLTGSVGEVRLAVTGSFNVISRNDVDPGGGPHAAVAVEGGVSNLVKRNYVRHTLSVDSENTVVRGNYVTDAFFGRSGLYAGHSTILKRNIAVHNSGHGIVASRRTVDAGGNRASFNGEDPQCIRIRCEPARECPGFVIGNGALDAECESIRSTDARARRGPGT